MKKFVAKFIRDEEGQDLIEYAMLAGFIALICVVAVGTTGQGVNNTFQNVSAQVNPLGS